MQIKVQKSDGKTIILNADRIDTVDSIKSKLQDLVGMSPDEQSLTFAGTELKNGDTLSDYNIHDWAKLEILGIAAPPPPKRRHVHPRPRSTVDDTVGRRVKRQGFDHRKCVNGHIATVTQECDEGRYKLELEGQFAGTALYWVKAEHFTPV